jgi:hypothetical protein
MLTIEQADDGDWELRKDGYIKAKSPDPRHVLIQFQHYLERTGDIRLTEADLVIIRKALYAMRANDAIKILAKLDRYKH